MSSRVKKEENIIRVTEAVAPSITIEWDPVTNGGQVTFRLMDMVTEDGVYKGLQPHKELKPKPGTRDMEATIVIPISEIMTSAIELRGNTYPGIVLMGLIKAYFEQLFSKRLEDQEERLANPPPTTPAPEENPTPPPVTTTTFPPGLEPPMTSSPPTSSIPDTSGAP